MYAAPDGTFDQASADEAGAALAAELRALEDLQIVEQTIGMLDALAAGVGAPAPTPADTVEIAGNTITIEGRANVEVRRFCGGWGAEPVADPSTGTLTLFAGVEGLAVARSAWIDIRACQLQSQTDVASVPLFLDAGSRRDVGDIRLDFGGLVPFDELDLAAPLVDVDLRGTLDPRPIANLDVDFLLLSGRLELRIPTDAGNLIVATDGQDVLQVRAANGVFTCDPPSGTCTNEVGDVVALAL